MIYRRILIISNRLPFKPVSRKKGTELICSSGGLVSSIKSYIDKVNGRDNYLPETPVIWIGSLEEKEIALLGEKKWTHDNILLEPQGLEEEIYNRYYNGFCNSTIWPLFHYFPSFAHYDNAEYESYVKVNQVLKEKVKSIYQPGDLIWVHDYHLMLLPEMIRKEIPDAAIGFFLHIPFPSFEIFRMLPAEWRKQLLNGLMGADLIGFHTNDYLQYFTKSVRQILGYDCQARTIVTSSRSAIVDSFPVSIDFNKFSSASSDPKIFNERNTIKKSLSGRSIIFSVDRLDYSKGIINRLEGFDTFLEKHREFRGKVTYTLVIVPSRDIIPKYRKNKKIIEELISKINGKYGSIDWSPVIYQYKNLDHSQLTALYLAADVALITPVRDGMNLVAKEFVATRVDKKGVLILSETAGAASELGEAIIINPTDRVEIADAIKTALEMPLEEQAERMDIMQKRIRNYDVVKWAEDFLSQLKQYKKMQEKLKVKELSETAESDIIKKYLHSEKRLFLLDYDGTLCPLRALPHQAAPSDELLALLKRLTEDKKNRVVIISGRPADVLQEWLGDLALDLVAEHGAFTKIKGQDWTRSVETECGWKTALLPVFTVHSDRCAGSFIEEKQMSLAWHYRNADHELGFARSRELINELLELSGALEFQVLEGNKVVEARARGVDKGTAATRWVNEYKEHFMLVAGDDKTDEDLFRNIPFGGFTIRIGNDQSIARYNYPSCTELLKLLSKLSMLTETIGESLSTQ